MLKLFNGTTLRPCGLLHEPCSSILCPDTRILNARADDAIFSVNLQYWSCMCVVLGQYLKEEPKKAGSCVLRLRPIFCSRRLMLCFSV